MASNIRLNDLIEALAGAVIEAQDNIERHQIANLRSYFDDQMRPRSLVVRLPSIQPQAEPGSEDYYRAPLLPLVSANMLKIKDVEITFDADLGQLLEAPSEEPEKGKGSAKEAVKDAGEAPRKDIFVDMAGSRQGKTGSIHVVLRVESADTTDGAGRLINHLAQTQGVFQTFKAD